MDTRERLLKYRDLYRTNSGEAKKFLDENGHDERFVSLVRLGASFLEGFRDRLEERVPVPANRRELQRAFEAEFIQGWTEVCEFAASRARDSARRVLA